MESGGEGEIFHDDGELVRRLTVVHRLVGTVLRPEEDPAVLVLDKSQRNTFELAHGEPDEAPPPSDNPLVNYEMNTPDEYANVLVGAANYLLQEFEDVWAASPDLRDKVMGYTDSADPVNFEYAVARRTGYFNSKAAENSTLAFTVWTIDLIGGALDGVSIDRASINARDDRAHLQIVTQNDEVRFSYIHDRKEQPLVKECVSFFGPGTRLVRVLAGVFDNEEHLDSILQIVAESARGFVPEDECIALLQRVRQAALLAQERELLAYTSPTLDQVNMMVNFLTAVNK